MADLVRDGKPQTWVKVSPKPSDARWRFWRPRQEGTPIKQPRTITSISGNTITLDVPLTDSIDKKWGAGQVQAYT